VQQTTIPLGRVDEFILNEQQRNHGIQFHIEKSLVAGNRNCPLFATSKKIYHCQFGPEDHTTPDVIASSQAAEAAGEKKVRHCVLYPDLQRMEEPDGRMRTRL